MLPEPEPQRDMSPNFEISYNRAEIWLVRNPKGLSYTQ